MPARVVSVGNITVGGTGKTPTALWLAERLAARGHRVAVVARGYRKRRRGVVVVGEAGRPLVAPEDGGDEAVMLARRFAGPVITAERRAEAAAFACARWAVDTIVLDDGFQHRALARDADLVLATRESETAWALPAGPLRERPAALSRARAVLAIDGTPPAVPGVPSFRGTLVARALVRPLSWEEEPVETLRGATVVAVAGVARPERFVAALERLGAGIGDVLRFPDHHAYGPADVARIAAVAGARPVVTTEKDFVKLEHHAALGSVRALRVGLEVEQEDALLDLVTAP